MTSVTQLLALSIFSILIFQALNSKVLALSNAVVIDQVQLGSTTSASAEYISLFNNSTAAIEVTSWSIVYSSSSDNTQTNLYTLVPPNKITKIMLKPMSHFVITTAEFNQSNASYDADATFKASLATTSGHIKVINSEKQAVDVLGWGSAVAAEYQPTNAPTNGKTLQRKIDDGMRVDTNNNLADFSSQALVLSTPKNLFEEQLQYTKPSNDLMITEILPNAIGTDSSQEFIELFNASDQPIPLKDYKILLSNNQEKEFLLPDVVLAPRGYISFSDLETGLTLPSSLANVILKDIYDNEIHKTDGYVDAPEGVAWALINDVWQYTYTPTRNAENVLLSAKPCPVGEYRNEDTGACRKISAQQIAKECDDGYERNTDTGRCRKLAVPAAVSTCKVGQIRNPETNRCRNITSANESKPCPSGQERNLETGRCRKVVTPAGPLNIKDIETPMKSDDPKLWIAGMAAVFVGGYGVFEWRKEILGMGSLLKAKFMLN